MPAVLKEAMEGQPLNALGPSVTFNEGLGYVGARDLIISLSHSFKYLWAIYMWASLPENAGDVGGSICCSFTAHIVRRPGMPLSHLFILSRFFALIRFQKHICGSAQRGIWQHTCHAFLLPTRLLRRQQTGLLLTLLSGKTKSHGNIFCLLFSEVGVSFLYFFLISTEVPCL